MTTITLNVPDFLAENYQDTIQFISVKLYEADKITLAQAAAIAELTSHEFMQKLIDYGIWIR